MSTATTAEPKLRLLLCRTCNVIEEIPDYDGPPSGDRVLSFFVEQHTDATGTPHIGTLYVVEERMWSRPEVRKEIVRQIKGGGSKGLDEFDEKFYDTRSTFHEDAMACYQQHLRPKEACPDWRSDTKILLPDTKADRKDLGLEAPSKSPGVKTYLCDFCVVRTYYQNKVNELKGLSK